MDKMHEKKKGSYIIERTPEDLYDRVKGSTVCLINCMIISH